MTGPGRQLMSMVVEVEPTGGPDKSVLFPASGDGPVIMGMYGELARHYGAAPETFVPHASTLDYVIAAVAACLAGTFRRALQARGVEFSVENLHARGVGEIEVDDQNVAIIRQVTVHYELTGIREDQQELVERARAAHKRGCPVSRSLEGGFEISTTLTLS